MSGDAELATLEGGLVSLLASLEGDALPEAGVLTAKAAELGRHFEALQAELGRAGAENQPTPRVEACLRLYALAIAHLAERREGITLQRAACQAARQRLEAQRPVATSGGSCDVRG